MINIKELKIPKDEVLRYLGHNKQIINEEMDTLIDETIKESKELFTPKYVLGEYKTNIQDTGVLLENTNLFLKGKDIKNHLLNAKTAVIMAVTLGAIIEKKIIYYERNNLTKALILDACATTAVEEVCDIIEERVKKEALRKGLAITFRYSPGYGDLPLSVQRDFINTLRADKTIGLTVSSHDLLLPRKSVTAIIGLIPKEYESKKRTCEVCQNYENCSFRREGTSCGS